MKFWQRTFLAVLLLFLLGFDLLLLGLLTRSGRQSEALIAASAQAEMTAIHSAVEEKLRSVSGHHASLTAEALRVHLMSFASLYTQQTAFFQIESGGVPVFTTLAAEGIHTGHVPESIYYLTWQGTTYLVQSLPLHVGDMPLTLTFFKDVSILAQHRQAMLRYGMAVYAGVSVLLAGLLLALLLRLTRPLTTLTQTTHDIAQGQLEKRVAVSRRDELGDFAVSFNQMADAVQRQMTALEAASQQRQWFIDSLSHELRTPVTAIVGYGEVLKYANITPDEQEKALTHIIDQGNRIGQLSEKLLDLARLQQGQIVMERVDLAEVAARASQSLKPALEEKSIHVTLDTAPAIVDGDALLLETMTINLLENAIRASDRGQGISLRTWIHDDAACLAVRDEGIGMAEAEQARVLEAFYRVDPSRSRRHGGVGLGLTLCREICLLHGATLRIRSAPGEGCEVTAEFIRPQQV